MRKINRIVNIALIFMLGWVFLSPTFGYGSSYLAKTLRLPIGTMYPRVRKVMTSYGEIYIETIEPDKAIYDKYSKKLYEIAKDEEKRKENLEKLGKKDKNLTLSIDELREIGKELGTASFDLKHWGRTFVDALFVATDANGEIVGVAIDKKPTYLEDLKLEVAEGAIVVKHEYQGKGIDIVLGKTVLERTIEKSYDNFVAIINRDNKKSQRTLESICSELGLVAQTIRRRKKNDIRNYHLVRLKDEKEPGLEDIVANVCKTAGIGFRKEYGDYYIYYYKKDEDKPFIVLRPESSQIFYYDKKLKAKLRKELLSWGLIHHSGRGDLSHLKKASIGPYDYFVIFPVDLLLLKAEPISVDGKDYIIIIQGEYVFFSDESAIPATYSITSCRGLLLHDPDMKIGVMLHADVKGVEVSWARKIAPQLVKMGARNLVFGYTNNINERHKSRITSIIKKAGGSVTEEEVLPYDFEFDVSSWQVRKFDVDNKLQPDNKNLKQRFRRLDHKIKANDFRLFDVTPVNFLRKLFGVSRELEEKKQAIEQQNIHL